MSQLFSRVGQGNAGSATHVSPNVSKPALVAQCQNGQVADVLQVLGSDGQTELLGITPTGGINQVAAVASTLAGSLTVTGVLTANGGTGPIVAPTSYTGAAGHVAIAFPGQWNTALLTDASAGAYTLATPAAGDVGKRLLIVSTTAEAHTITAATHTITDGSGTNGDTLTCAAQIGAACELLAVSTSGWNVISYLHVTLSEA